MTETRKPTQTKTRDGVELTITWGYDSNTAQVTAILPDSGRSSVEVYGPHDAFGERIGAQVNWAGCGTRTPADARAYATAIAEACDIADAMNGGLV